jgi:cytochrome c oxidase cbb3-type subunit 1
MAETNTPTLTPPPADRRDFAAERAALDASTRGPVLVFFSAAIFWLVVGSIFALIASTKMHTPGFTLGTQYDTFGRMRPAHLNTVIYGWASNVGIGVLLWLMARLSRAKLIYPVVLYIAAALWNGGIAIGTVGIIVGQSTGIEWLEFPPYIPPILASAVSIIAVWALLMFVRRREKHVYVTQWYVFAALFWFPWLYTVASLLMLYAPVRGVVQSTVNWWFAHNVLGLWFTPIGLGAAYYLIPKVIGRPIHSYYLSIVGFWSLALFYNWLGMHHLVGGPIPSWMISASIVASILMLIPVVAVGVNHHLTMSGHFHLLRYSPTLRFVVFGAFNYTIVSVQGSFESLRSFHEVAHFTHYTIGHAHLGLYAFYSMVMFGSMYYIVPRLTGWEWASGNAIRVHFWCTAVGISIYVLALSIGGWREGYAWLNGALPNTTVAQIQVPYLWCRTIGGLLMTIGHFTFAGLFVANMLKYGMRRSGPTYFVEKATTTPERELVAVPS